MMPRCCMDFDIRLEDLLFPERLSPEGLEFLRAHGVDRVPLSELRDRALDLGNGTVKIFHRCDQLDENGRCRIYKTRPQICRDFDCTTRHDCACRGKGVIWNAELDLF